MNLNLSILIATLPENFQYLQKCTEYIEKHSTYNHEILVYLNGIGAEEQKNFLNEKSIKFLHSEENLGVSVPINKLFRLSSNEFIMNLNDDMLVLPEWDIELNNTYQQHFKNVEHFYLTPRIIEPNVPYHVKHCSLGNYGNTL